VAGIRVPATETVIGWSWNGADGDGRLAPDRTL